MIIWRRSSRKKKNEYHFHLIQPRHVIKLFIIFLHLKTMNMIISVIFITFYLRVAGELKIFFANANRWSHVLEYFSRVMPMLLLLSACRDVLWMLDLTIESTSTKAHSKHINFFFSRSAKCVQTEAFFLWIHENSIFQRIFTFLFDIPNDDINTQFW